MIALVVTIVVLIILATISIQAVFGENGLIKQAQEAKEFHEQKQQEELEELNKLDEQLGAYLNGTGGGTTEPEENIDPETGWDLDKVDKVTSEDNIVVPVPKGYTASTITGEKSVDTGFVIKEGDNGGATEGINEFVWVPVPEISDIYDEAHNAGQLWDFGTYSSPRNPALKQSYPTTPNSGNREPDVVTDASEGQDSASGSDYDADPANLQQAGFNSDLNTDGTVDAYDFKIQLQNEFNSMIESVKIYKGFYIGRYETGDLSKEEAVVQKNNSDINNQTWYTQYKLSKTIGANGNVTSSMIWGCQWDAAMRWMQRSEKEDVKKFPTNSKGNYSGSRKATGSNPAYAVNNIYDMAGNVYDWTLESSSTYSRYKRGCFYNSVASVGMASRRDYDRPIISLGSGDYNGSRATLYVAP